MERDKLRKALSEYLASESPKTKAIIAEIARIDGLVGSHQFEESSSQKSDALNALLSQYNSIRQESMSSTNNRIQILTLGMAAIAAICGGSFASEKGAENNPWVPIIFSDAITAVCIFVLILWVSEAVRAQRAGYFIASEIEPKINERLGRFVMTWETALWAEFLDRDELWGPSMIAVAVFGLIGGLSVILGFGMGTPKFDVFQFSTYRLSAKSFVLLYFPSTMLVIASIYAGTQFRRLRNRSKIKSPFLV